MIGNDVLVKFGG